MIREHLNEIRASKGMNAIPTGKVGKGQAPRMSEKPFFAGMKACGKTASGLIEFKVSDRHMKYVTEEDVRKWEVISGEKIIQESFTYPVMRVAGRKIPQKQGG